MPHTKASITICGAGILGVSVAYFLAVRHGLKDILLVDERAPLTLTSDKSTECYRNWWPGPGDAMLRLMNRSIDLLEEFAGLSGNSFHLNQRGYLYLTSDPASVVELRASAEEASALGAGELRIHDKLNSAYIPHQPEGYANSPRGADLLLDRSHIQSEFPYLSQDTVAALHVRRAGWLSAQQYGAWLLDQARAADVRFLSGRVTAVETTAGAVSQVHLADGSQISTPIFVNAAGPHLAAVGELLGAAIPVYNELHLKASFDDHLGIVPRHAPLLICADPQQLPWTDEERAFLAGDPGTAWLLETLPSGAHTRPEGGDKASSVLVLWDLHDAAVEPIFPLPEDPMYTELALRGLSRILPGMRAYSEKIPRPFVDGGYYTKTRENRPLSGPLPASGAYLIGGASGYGIMASAALAELLAAHITGVALPTYAPAFSLARYEDPAYQGLLENWGDSWQL